MTVETGKSSRALAPWLHKALAIAVFAATSAGLYYVMNLPATAPIEGKIVLGPGETLALVSPAPGQVIEIEGPKGKGLTLTFSRATLDGETIASLNGEMIDGEFSPAPGPIEWFGQDGGTGPTLVDLALSPTGRAGSSALEITSRRGAGHVAELAMRPRHAILRARIVSPLGAGPEDGEGEVEGATTKLSATGAHLTFSALPVGLTMPEGGRATLLTPSTTAADTSVFLGVPNDQDAAIARSLKVSAFEVLRPTGISRYYACGSDARGVSWKQRDIRRLDCRRSLQALTLTLKPSAVEFEVTGEAFIIKDGTQVVLGWFDRLKANPLIAALLAIVFGAVAGWTFKTVTAKPVAPPGPVKPRRSRQPHA